MGFVITAGKDITGSSDHDPAPHSKTVFAKFPTMIMSVGTLYIPTVTRIGRHQGMTILVVIELGGFEGQLVGSEGLIDALEVAPFVFIGL